jgi:tRNA threonylcarbamoyladenosine biosynthesis protein TsaB
MAMMIHSDKPHRPESEPVLLALETSGMCGSIALVTQRQCLGEYTLLSKQTHSRRLLGGIDWLLREAGLDWTEIGGLAVSLGPGSFTGLRIGLSTAKGLAMAAGIPLLGVAALDGLAAQLAHAAPLICPVLDARKQEVYAAFYRPGPVGAERVSDYMVLSPAALAAKINESVILVGDGAVAYEELFRKQLGETAIIASGVIYFPRAAAIGQLAFSKWQKQEFLEPASAVPLYIRPSEAEMNLKNRTLQEGCQPASG